MKASPLNKLFSTTDCLSEDILINYSKGNLSPAQVHQVEFHLLDCELCSLASAGFAAASVSSSDLNTLRSSVRKKYTSSLLSKVGIGLVFLSLLVTPAIFIFQNKKENKVQISETVELKNRVEMISAKPTNIDPGKESIIFSEKENFISINNTPGENTFFNPDNAQDNHIDQPVYEEPVIDKSVVFGEEEEQKPGQYVTKYNSPVRFIENLKISNYEKLYLKNEETNKSVYGTPSKFENKNSINNLPELSHSISADEILRDAMKNITKRKYSKAKEKLALLHEYNGKDENANFYLGFCNYHLKDFNSSEKFFRSVMKSESNVFEQEARWYLALSQIESGKINEASSLLMQIIAQKGFYREQAETKLREIK